MYLRHESRTKLFHKNLKNKFEKKKIFRNHSIDFVVLFLRLNFLFCSQLIFDKNWLKKRESEIYLFDLSRSAKWIEFYLFQQRSNAHSRSWKRTKTHINVIIYNFKTANLHSEHHKIVKWTWPHTHEHTEFQMDFLRFFALFSFFFLPFVATQSKFNFFSST